MQVISDRAPIRVAYCIDSMAASGGTELHAARLAEQTVSHGVRPIVLTLNGDGPMIDRYARAGIPVHSFPVTSLVGSSAVRQVRAMAALLSREEIDVVHTHDCYTNFLGSLAGRLARAPLVVASKRWTKHFFPQHAWTNRIAFRTAHWVVANSSAVAKTVVTDERIAASRVRVSPNFLLPQAFEPVPEGERLTRRAALGYESDDVVFCILAQLRAEKDHSFLLRAFKAVTSVNRSARLLIVGDGPLRRDIEQLISAMDLTQSVLLAGHSATPRDLLGISDVSVLSSQHEGFPNALLEGMALGLPVISTAVGGVLDAVEDGVSGVLVTPGDEGGFTGAMHQLARDPGMRASFGAAGRRVAYSNYEASNVVTHLVGMYREHLKSII